MSNSTNSRYRASTWLRLVQSSLWPPLLLLLLLTISASASVGGSISGTVTDPHGALVVAARVTALHSSTNLRQSALTDTHGVYSFRELPIGSYTLTVEAPGFKKFDQTNILLDAGSQLLLDVALVLGVRTETITISSSNVRVQTADTQLGEVIENFEATSVPLNGRSFTDLLALQPGIAPATTFTAGSLTAAGASTISPSGNLNPGTISINGQREFANGFTINGATVGEPFTMGAAIIPNLDSIAEFRILTSNVDAEYGNYSGGQISVVTRSGSSRLHGTAFEFFRNTALDARNFYSPERATFQQNQFGATLGGPVRNPFRVTQHNDHLFFFADYQGTRMTQGVDSGQIPVPSRDNRAGNFLNGPVLTGNVSGPFWAAQLAQRLGYPVTAEEPYYTPGCTLPTQCVFPNAAIPQRAFSTPAQHLLQYIPAPNLPGGAFATSAQNQTLLDDKGALRLDANTPWVNLSAYYSLDDYALNNPYPTQQGGASVPGFNALNHGRAQLLNLVGTTTFNARTVNQLQFSYMRDVNILGSPIGGVGTSLVSQGFVTADGQPSILPQRPAIEGVENVIFNNFILGSTITGLNQVDNVFQLSNNFSRVLGSHIVKLGGELLFNQVNANANVQSNGTFSFFGSETGSDFADFLIGTPSRYTQGDAQPFYMRNRYGALFVQDSWRLHPNLTFNYGLRWDVAMPWYEKFNQIQTLVPGQQSIVFPGAPTGLVFPGDPGIARSLAPTRWNNLSPRLGLAYTPGTHRGLLGLLTGDHGQSSLRLGFGRFFSAVEGISAGVMAGDAPYGSTYTSPAPPLFTNPFVTAATGQNNQQRFPLHFPPLNASAAHPNPNVNWAPFLPITGLPGYAPNNVSPYAEQYNLSYQRQLDPDTVLSINYIGSQAHHLLVLLEANPGNPALCLSLSQQSQVAPGSATCGPFGETNTYTSAAGQTIQGTRAPFGGNFGSVDYLTTIGNSNYNSLNVTLRHVSAPAQILLGYTYSKSLDLASSISDQLNPFNYHQTYALSAFDVTHSFIASYTLQVPFDRLTRTRNRLTEGWVLSGITRFSTGFPVTLTNSSDNSLLGTQPDGVNPFGVDLPQVQPVPLNLNHNPRNGLPYFNTARFTLQPLGQPGNASRRSFYGPGIDNFDFALQKYLRLKESSFVEFRIEAFNAFNHAQFYGSTAVNGDVNSTAFGQINSAAPPRLLQAAIKLSF